MRTPESAVPLQEASARFSKAKRCSCDVRQARAGKPARILARSKLAGLPRRQPWLDLTGTRHSTPEWYFPLRRFRPTNPLAQNKSHARDPIAVGKPLLHLRAVEACVMRIVPLSESSRRDFIPLVDDYDGKPVVQCIEWRAPDDGDIAEGERFPGAMTVQPAAVRTDDKGVARLIPPESAARHLARLKINVGIRAKL